MNIKIRSDKIYQNNVAYIPDKVDDDETNILQDHFATNFSINQKDGEYESAYDYMQQLQTVPYETSFESVDQSKVFLHDINTILVPPLSQELTYTGMSWGVTPSDVNFKFGSWKYTNFPGDYVELSFSGVSVAVSMCWLGTVGLERGVIETSLSNDNGVTWYNKKLFSSTVDVNAIYNFNKSISLYSGLEYGDYKVRVTLKSLNGTAACIFNFFSYTTYLINRPVTQYYHQATAVKTLVNLPPLTMLFTGTYVSKNYLSTQDFNAFHFATNNNGATIEYKFYGSKTWINLRMWGSSSNNIGILIDGATTSVKNPTLTFISIIDGTTHYESIWVRLDNGTLDEGWHTVKITNNTTNYICTGGFAYYSSVAVSTVCRSLICGKDSYIEVAASNSNFTYSASWTIDSSSVNSLRRYQSYTNTFGDYVTIQTPNNPNLKAIYFLTQITTNRTSHKISLDGSLVRYVNTDTDSGTLSSTIILLYDSYLDGDLSNKTLKFEHESNDGQYISIEGVIFEIGYPAETNYITCMPKWTRMNNAYYYNCPVPISERLDIYGTSIAKSPGRKPIIHSGWTYSASPNASMWRSGVGVDTAIQKNMVVLSSTTPSDWSNKTTTPVTGISGDINYEHGLFQHSNNVTNWVKYIMRLNRPI